MNRLKVYTFDNYIMTIIHITKVLQHIDYHDLILLGLRLFISSFLGTYKKIESSKFEVDEDLMN